MKSYKSTVRRRLDLEILCYLFEELPFLIYAIDMENHELVYTNKAMTKRIGNKIGKVCHNEIFLTSSICDFCKNSENLKNKMDSEKIEYEHFDEVSDNWYKHYEVSVKTDEGKRIKYVVMVNINDLKLAQNQVIEAHALMALKNINLEVTNTIDSLTQIYNRFKIESILEESLKSVKLHGKTFTLMILDIDFFKLVNDRFGHLAGDKVLIEFAAEIKENVRKSDAIGRWGGEEFLLILNETDLDGAILAGENLLDVIRNHQFTEVGNLNCSIGVTCIKKDDTITTVIERADNALYCAKESGRDCLKVK